MHRTPLKAGRGRNWHVSARRRPVNNRPLMRYGGYLQAVCDARINHQEKTPPTRSELTNSRDVNAPASSAVMVYVAASVGSVRDSSGVILTVR